MKALKDLMNRLAAEGRDLSIMGYITPEEADSIQNAVEEDAVI